MSQTDQERYSAHVEMEQEARRTTDPAREQTAKTLTPGEVKSIEDAIVGVLEGFSWAMTQQGHDYWQGVVNNLAAIIGRPPSDF